MKAIINPEECICCEKCAVAKACSIKAVFRLGEGEPAVVDMSLCHGCGLCAAKCPADAVVLKES